MKHITAPQTGSDSLEARFGARLSARLSERSEQLPHDISERLRFARESALSRAREVRSAQTRPIRELSRELVGMGSSAALSGGAPERSPWWLKFASVLPLLALVVGLVLINEGQLYEQILAAADVDTALLADNLPPTAYSDPGFSEYLAGEDE